MLLNYIINGIQIVNVEDDQPEAKRITPDPASKKKIVPSFAENPPFSSPCMLGEHEDFDPNYLPDYSREKK